MHLWGLPWREFSKISHNLYSISILRVCARGHNKKRHLYARHKVFFMNNPKASFGLESFDLEAVKLWATRYELSTWAFRQWATRYELSTWAQAEGLANMSHGRGATRLELVDKSLNRLMAEMQCWIQLLLSFSEGTLFNRARKTLSSQYDCINQTQKLC